MSRKDKDQITVYPSPDVAREITKISEEDHGRPLAHTAEMAMKAFIVLWRRDKYEAQRVVDEFAAASVR
jgi:hypothetical protein